MKPLHFSALKWMAKSPAHYRYYLDAPFVPTPAMRLGTLVHQAVLGGPEPVIFDGARRGKAWDEFRAANEGVEVFTADEAAKAQEIADAVAMSPAHDLIQYGRKEQPIEWTLNGGAVPCAGRIDCYGVDGKGEAFVLDLKTTACAEPGRFPWDALRRGYVAQLAWYGHGLRSTNLCHPADHYVLAVETAPPYPVVLYRITARALDAGTALWRSWLERLLVCQAADVWPGYTQTVTDLDINDTEDDLDWTGIETTADAA